MGKRFLLEHHPLLTRSTAIFKAFLASSVLARYFCSQAHAILHRGSYFNKTADSPVDDFRKPSFNCRIVSDMDIIYNNLFNFWKLKWLVVQRSGTGMSQTPRRMRATVWRSITDTQKRTLSIEPLCLVFSLRSCRSYLEPRHTNEEIQKTT